MQIRDDLKNGLILEAEQTRLGDGERDKPKRAAWTRNDYCIKSLRDQRQIIDDNGDVTIGTQTYRYGIGGVNLTEEEKRNGLCMQGGLLLAPQRNC